MRTMGTSKLGLLFAALLATTTVVQTTATPDASARRRRPSKGTIAPQVVSDLRGNDIALAEAAVETLGKTLSTQSANALLDALAMGMHPGVASKALDALALHGKLASSSANFDVVEFYAHHRNAKVRSSAVKVMGTLKDKRAAKLVLKALHDEHKSVRAAASGILAAQKNRSAVEPMMALLKKGDEAAGQALASLADADLARNIAELIGSAPDGLISRTLGSVLMRPSFGPEDARVEVVKALGKIPGNDALEQLTNYLGSIPEKPPRKSRSEAEAIVEARLGG